MMQILLIGAALIGLTACGGGKTGPGEISAFGLVYDQRPGQSFEGLPKTALGDMPTGTAEMRGPSRARASDGTMVFEDAMLDVNFTTNAVSYSADYVFPAGAPVGIVQVRQTATLDGTRFQGQNGDGYLSGGFYGQNGNVAAGFYNSPAGNGDTIDGAFIVGN